MMAWARDYSGIVNKEEYVCYSKEPLPPEIDDEEEWLCCRHIEEQAGFLYVCELWMRFSGMGSLARVKRFHAHIKAIKNIDNLRQLPRGRTIALQIRKFQKESPEVVSIKSETGKGEGASAQTEISLDFIKTETM